MGTVHLWQSTNTCNQVNRVYIWKASLPLPIYLLYSTEPLLPHLPSFLLLIFSSFLVFRAFYFCSPPPSHPFLPLLLKPLSPLPYFPNIFASLYRPSYFLLIKHDYLHYLLLLPSPRSTFSSSHHLPLPSPPLSFPSPSSSLLLPPPASYQDYDDMRISLAGIWMVLWDTYYSPFERLNLRLQINLNFSMLCFL